jgi:RHS repeat-associated protein
MQIPGRSYDAAGAIPYRYGFNGQEKTPEVSSNTFTAEFWQYDARIGRRLNVDPVTKEWESSFATFANNPIVMIDPNGLDWYRVTKGNDKGQVQWHEGNGKRKNMKHLGETYDGYTQEGREKKWMHGNRDGHKEVWLEEVVVSAQKRISKSLMSRTFPDFDRIDRNSYEDFQKRPKPVYYDENPLKTIFWDGIINPFNPFSDIDVYISGSLKHKIDLPKLPKSIDASATIVYAGIQGGLTSNDSQGFYGNLITGDNSYLSFKKGGTEVRTLPLRGIMPTMPFSGSPIYGDFSPQLRTITDIAVYRGIIIQSEVGVARNTNPTLGLRGKLESPKVLGWSAETAVGIRTTLQMPPIIRAIQYAFE